MSPCAYGQREDYPLSKYAVLKIYTQFHKEGLSPTQVYSTTSKSIQAQKKVALSFRYASIYHRSDKKANVFRH